MLPHGAWFRLGFVLFVMCTLLLALRAYQVRSHPEPELVRKLFHLGGGLISLSFPWVFQEPWPVLLVGLLAAGAFAGLRTIPPLKSGMGQVLYGVERESLGEFFFLASVCLLFYFARGNKFLYVVPLLVLILADAVAALVGKQYGRVLYWSAEGEKSAEGSLSFFVAAFFCVHIPLLLWTGVGRAESLLIAANIGVLVMLAEAIAWRGVDNLFIPLFSFVLLGFFWEQTATDLTAHLGVLLGLALLVRLWRNRTTLSDDALCGAVLFGYLVWTLADWHWLLPPLILFVTYTALSKKTMLDPIRLFNVRVLLGIASAALFWLFLYWSLEQPVFFYPYVAALSANLSIIALVRARHAAPQASLGGLLAINGGKGALILIPSLLAADGLTMSFFENLAVGMMAIFLATAYFCAVQPALETYPINLPRWIRQSILVGVTSVICLAPYSADLLGGA